MATEEQRRRAKQRMRAAHAGGIRDIERRVEALERDMQRMRWVMRRLLKFRAFCRRTEQVAGG